MADQLRRLAGPTGLDQRPNSLTLVQRVWGGGRKGVGAAVDTTLITFPGHLPVHELLEKDIASSGGRYKERDVVVSRITPADPANPGIGYTPDQLDPTLPTDGTEYVYVIAGPLAGEYRLVEIKVGGRAAHPGGFPGYGGVYSYAIVLRKQRPGP